MPCLFPTIALVFLTSYFLSYLLIIYVYGHLIVGRGAWLPLFLFPSIVCLFVCFLLPPFAFCSLGLPLLGTKKPPPLGSYTFFSTVWLFWSLRLIYKGSSNWWLFWVLFLLFTAWYLSQSCDVWYTLWLLCFFFSIVCLIGELDCFSFLHHVIALFFLVMPI